MAEKITNYQLIKEIGAGGMGRVYEAVDARLDRRVALKILPADIAVDRKRLNRFLQEARLAANLNHPNICTIYEVNSSADVPYLAMELIEGETLDRKIDQRSVGLEEILAIASQIVDALDEAHRQGIIHRDIKASNIIINRRGQVKVLDFGLAKPVAEEVSELAVTRAKTEEGMLVGTVQYMSPEQALGKPLDARTDLWSLGVLLYEMICGQLPFRAATQAGVFDEILHRPPTAPSEINPDVPVELENIIFKLLEKEREFRYQTASDLLVDLKRLRRSMGDLPDSGETVRTPTEQVRLRTESGFRHRPTGPVRMRRRLWLAALVVLVAAVALGGVFYAAWQMLSPKSTGGGFDNAVSTRLTNLGKVFDAVVSPDGKYVVYVNDDGARQTLWLKQTDTGSAVQIFGPSEYVFQGLAVSPDNNWVYFNVWDRKSVGQIFRLPALGGVPQKIVHDCMPGVSISPDGKRLAFIRSDDRNKRFLLMTIGTDGSDEREVLSAPDTYLEWAAWAPDGQTIAFGMFRSEEGRRFPQIAEIPAGGGDIKTIWKDPDNKVQPRRFVWLADKSGLLVTLHNSREFQSQIWRINYADGSLAQVTRDLNSYNALSITADGKSLLSIQQDYLLSIWVVPADNSEPARRITEGRTEGIGIDWTPGGEIVYASNVSGTAEVWLMKADGTEKKQLTSDKILKLKPCVSSDGKHVFFNLIDIERGGTARIDLDGRNQTVFENKWLVSCPTGTPYIFYLADTGEGGARLFRDTTAVDSPEYMSNKTIHTHTDLPKKVTDKPVQDYAVSPDGKMIAYTYWDEEKRAHAAETMVLETGVVKTFELPLSAAQKYGESQYVLRWTPDGKNLSFVNDENGFSNVWLLPLNGDKPRKTTYFNDNYIFSFAWSRDGRRLAVSRGTITSDAVLFKQTD